MIKDIEWLSYFVTMLHDEYAAGVIGEYALLVGLNLVRDKAIDCA